jgi:hypothetical protein
MLNLFDIWNDPKIHQTEIPAAIGISNPWSIARLYAAFIGNIKDKLGQQLLNGEMMKRAIIHHLVWVFIDLITLFPLSVQMYSDITVG